MNFTTSSTTNENWAGYPQKAPPIWNQELSQLQVPGYTLSHSPPIVFTDTECRNMIQRLMEFMGLPDELRELLTAAAKKPSDRTFWQVVADALEERGMEEDSKILRKKVVV